MCMWIQKKFYQKYWKNVNITQKDQTRVGAFWNGKISITYIINFPNSKSFTTLSTT